MPSIVEKVIALADAFDENGIPFAFGGALALAYATENPRGTRDIDINVFVKVDGAPAIVAGLPAEVVWSDDDLKQLRRDDQVRLWWGDTPVDLFFNANEFHDEVARRAVTVPFSGRSIPVLAADDLAVFKVLFDRGQDWVDLQRMVDAGSLDVGRVVRRISMLLGPDGRIDRLRRLLFRGEQ